MDTDNPFMECSVLSVPSEYIHTMRHCETIQHKLEPLNICPGSNTVIISKNIYIKLGLDKKFGSINSWVVLKFNLKFYKLNQKIDAWVSSRLVQIVTNEYVSEDTVIFSEDLLYNLNSQSKSSVVGINPRDTPYLLLNDECFSEIIYPTKASNVVLCLLHNETFFEDSFIDKLLLMYFSQPKYLCNNDVFGVNLEDHMLEFISSAYVDTIYFKVCEIHGLHNTKNEHSSAEIGYFVDSSVQMYQTANQQSFLPQRRFSMCYKHLFLSSCDDFIQRVKSNNQNLLPLNYKEVFSIVSQWLEPFLSRSKHFQVVDLNPVFLLSGQNGSGKTLLLKAVSQYFGVSYCRVDCVTVGRAIPGQTEAKVKAIFNQLKTLSPCILHLSNIEALYQDADFKDDVRVISCFEQLVRTSKFEWPVVIVATTHNCKCISCNINHLFLDTASINAPDYEQRQDIISWLVHQQRVSFDSQILHTVASQTSGFVFRDLQILVTLAFKEKYKRSKEENKDNCEFAISDFSKIIGTMHKAFSESIGAPKVPSVSWKDVGGLEPLKKEILRSLRSSMFNTGLKRSGLLLHGPPGTGKTLLAKAVATQCGRNFLSVKGPELLNMYVGQSEHNVRDLFELAKVASPCIIFFDELDSLAPNRGHSGDSGGVMDRVVSQLLAEMDDLRSSGDVFILGATNRPDLIDPALLRPGRLDKLLYVGPCEDHSSKLSVIKALTQKLCLDPGVDLEEIVPLLPASVSGAQLSALCSAAWLTSVRQLIHSGEHKSQTSVIVNRDHFLSALGSTFT